jgi:DNA-binding MarR family transcriptional regulator
MHAIFFGTKRAFHATLRIVRKPLKAYGLTSARFDLLWILEGASGERALQSTLRKMLGVTAPTVSRMVKSLEALGLVRTERARIDRRQRYVELTKAGLERIRAAAECFVRGRIGKRILRRTFGTGWTGGRRTDEAFRQTSELEDMLRCVRAMCGDTATLHYPGHPDD